MSFRQSSAAAAVQRAGRANLDLELAVDPSCERGVDRGADGGAVVRADRREQLLRV
jgi:hypothetical protein